jgi:heterotetrameric sarcosine oxidase gamma subunit
VTEELTLRSPWSGLLTAGRQGRPDGPAGVVVAAGESLAIAMIEARRGGGTNVAARIRRRYALDLPSGPRWSGGDGLAFIWSGPLRWLAIAQGARAAGWVDDLRGELTGAAAVTDQGDGLAVLRLAGPQARNTLMKGVGIDLHPRAFAHDAAALTIIAHMTVQLWQIDDAPTYELAVPRTLVASFWRWLAAAAAESGLEVTAT